MDILNIVAAGFWWLASGMCAGGGMLAWREHYQNIISRSPVLLLGNHNNAIKTEDNTRASAPSSTLPYPATGRHKDMWKGEEVGRGVFDSISGRNRMRQISRLVEKFHSPKMRIFSLVATCHSLLNATIAPQHIWAVFLLSCNMIKLMFCLVVSNNCDFQT